MKTINLIPIIIWINNEKTKTAAMARLITPMTGTYLKLSMTFEIENKSMDSYDWKVEFSCGSGSVTLQKSECIYVDKNEYIACIDTSKLGSGTLSMKVTAFIPDDNFVNFPTGKRVEVAKYMTDVQIY